MQGVAGIFHGHAVDAAKPADAGNEATLPGNDVKFVIAAGRNVLLGQVAAGQALRVILRLLDEADLDLVAGVLGLVCDRNLDIIAKSRIGASMLTMILRRAESIKRDGGGSEDAWRAW